MVTLARTGYASAMSPALLSLAELAPHVRERLAVGAASEAFRLVADWYSRARVGAPPEIERALATTPDSTGDRRWDAMLAGIAEQICLERSVQCPRWPFAAERFLDSWWFMTPHRSLHPSAFVEAPAALANHGVFIHRADFESL